MLPFLRVDTITTKAINRLIITNVEHKLVLHELEVKLELELHILKELELGAYASELEPELELNPYELELIKNRCSDLKSMHTLSIERSKRAVF